MAYRKAIDFTPPKLRGATAEEKLAELEAWVTQLCQKLNTEFQNVERGG